MLNCEPDPEIKMRTAQVVYGYIISEGGRRDVQQTFLLERQPITLFHTLQRLNAASRFGCHNFMTFLF